jgi:hypothetical protein
LRGGETLILPPNTTSRAIVEEALYDNHHFAEWERAGWVRRLPARMDDVIAEASPVYPFDPGAEAFAAARAEAIAARTKAAADGGSDTDESGAAPSSEPASESTSASASSAEAPSDEDSSEEAAAARPRTKTNKTAQ